MQWVIELTEAFPTKILGTKLPYYSAAVVVVAYRWIELGTLYSRF